MRRYFEFKLPHDESVTFRIEDDYSVTRCYFKEDKLRNKINTSDVVLIRSYEEAYEYILSRMEEILETVIQGGYIMKSYEVVKHKAQEFANEKNQQVYIAKADKNNHFMILFNQSKCTKNHHIYETVNPVIKEV